MGHGWTQGGEERGLTIDVAHKRFNTQKYYFTIIDAPVTETSSRT